MRARSGPTVALRLVASRLRAYRERAGLTVEDTARQLSVHELTVTRIENAKTGLKPATVRTLLEIYDVEAAERGRILDALVEANRPGWWHEYRDVLPDYLVGVIDLESAADTIRAYAPGTLPDLVQTPDYARELLARRHPRDSGDRIERRVQLLTARQHHAFRRARPLRLWALVEETALTRPVGPPEVMRAQYEHLRLLTSRSGVSVALQVLQSDAGPHPMLVSGPVELLRFSQPGLDDRLIVRGLHPAAATVTDDATVLSTYKAAMDATAVLALPPRGPLPIPELQRKDQT